MADIFLRDLHSILDQEINHLNKCYQRCKEGILSGTPASENLNNTLPFLTGLYVFSYGFTQEGELVPPESPPEWMIQRAQEFGVRLILTLTPLGPRTDRGRLLAKSQKTPVQLHCCIRCFYE